jgi:hypothetical protein
MCRFHEPSLAISSGQEAEKEEAESGDENYMELQVGALQSADFLSPAFNAQ